MLSKFLSLSLSYGVRPTDDIADVNRTKLLNLCIYLGVFVFTPIGLIANWYSGEWREVWLIAGFNIVYLVCFILNLRGKDQSAYVLLACAAILVSVLSTFMTHTQSAAPYGSLAVGTISVFVFKKRTLKFLFASLAFGFFASTNLYQLNYREFDSSESIVIVTLLGFVVLALLYAENEINNYQIRLTNQNRQLEKKNEQIKDQSDQIIKMTKEKHAHEMLLKQKDLESVLMTTKTDQQMAKNVTDRVKKVLKMDNHEKGLKQLLGELSHQRVIEDRLKRTRENILDINAEFYDRLLTKYPDLTKSERELTAHLRLNLTNKEIAAIKQSTMNSVNVAKARLRKKMGFASNKELREFLIRF